MKGTNKQIASQRNGAHNRPTACALPPLQITSPTRLKKTLIFSVFVTMNTCIATSTAPAFVLSNQKGFQNGPGLSAWQTNPTKFALGELHESMLLTSPSSAENLATKEENEISPSFFDPALLMKAHDVAARENIMSLRSKLNVPSNHAYFPKRDRPLVVGHRGSIYEELENTIRGFQVSAEMGIDAVELDVFLLSCGTLVVFHGGGDDASPGCLRDYCNIQGSILDYQAHEARLFAFNPYHEEFGCGPNKVMNREHAYIPTLAEVLLALKGTGTLVKIELKGSGTAKPVLELVERLGMVDQCHYSSFDHEKIKQIRHLRPELNPDGTHKYKTGALFTELPDDFVDRARRVGASEVHMKYDTCTTDRVQEAHEAGMGTMAWFRGPIGMREDTTHKYLDVGNEDEDMYNTVMATGVRSMCVNRPNKLLQMVGRAQGIMGDVKTMQIAP